MKTLRYLIITLLLTLGGISAHAQGHNEKMPEEKIKALKIAFLTSRLELTTTEAQAFWPLYNEYQNKTMELHKSKMNIGKALKSKFDQLTDAEMNKLMDEYIALKQKETAIEVEYLEKFRKVLPVKKIAMLLKAERDFKAEVLKEYKNRAPDGPPPGGK